MKTKRGGQTTVANRDTASGHTVGGEDGVRGGVPWFCLVDVCKIRQGDVCKRLARGGGFNPTPFDKWRKKQSDCRIVALSHVALRCFRPPQTDWTEHLNSQDWGRPQDRRTGLSGLVRKFMQTLTADWAYKKSATVNCCGLSCCGFFQYSVCMRSFGRAESLLTSPFPSERIRESY